LNPENPETHLKLGLALALQGKLEEATAACRQAVALEPAGGKYLAGLAHVLQEQGQTEAAADYYRQALQLDPGFPAAADRQAWPLATHPDPDIRNGALAVLLAKQACQATGYRQPQFLDTLAAAYAEAGQFDRARETARKALALLQGNPFGQAQAIQARLNLYEAHQAFRDETRTQ